MTVLDKLNGLRAVHIDADALEDEIKSLEAPFKKAIEEATKAKRAALNGLRTLEKTLSAEAAAGYTQAATERAAAMAANPDHPPPAVALPAGCSVSWLTRLEVVNADALPRFVLVIDEKAAKDALSAAIDVPGARLTQVPSFKFTKSKDESK